MLQFQTCKKMLQAAGIIEQDGVEGLEKASELVAKNVATGMLVMHLMHTLKAGSAPDTNDDVSDRIRNALAQAGLTR